jgi:hypothetical protein
MPQSRKPTNSSWFKEYFHRMLIVLEEHHLFFLESKEFELSGRLPQPILHF